MPQVVLDSKGEPIRLNRAEQHRATTLQNQYNRELKNSLGFEIPITTLSMISKSIVEQKFFEIAPADYLPVRVGNGAWSSEIVTYRDYAVGGDFEDGVINTGTSNTRLSETSAAIDAIHVPTRNWAKGITWALPELKQAALSGNWDLVTSKERSRKKNWDLGIQAISFLGSKTDTNVLGLLTQPDVTSNTSLITQFISSMTPTQFATFVAGVVKAYRINCNYTAWPTHFIMPEDDYNGLTVPVSASFPNIAMITYLEDAFKRATRNPNFKIMPLAYANETQNNAYNGLNKNRYTLMNYDEDTLRMDIPVDYTNTLQNTLNGFQFQNVGYGQYTGAKAYRPLEVLYFDFT